MIFAHMIVISCLIISSVSADEQSSPFDLAVQEIMQQPLSVPPENSTPTSSIKNESHMFSYENCQTAIDSIALFSAAIRVYNRYQRIYGPPVEMDWWEKTWNKVCPEIIQDATQHSKLFKETVEIVFETVTIKTTAKLVLFCWKGDAGMMIKSAGQKIKRFFRLLL